LLPRYGDGSCGRVYNLSRESHRVAAQWRCRETNKYMRILIVDDDPKVRLLLKRCFEQESYDVIEAATGAEAHACLTAGDVSLVTLDLGLGSEDGLDIAREIRARSDVPIIMVTGKGDTIDRVVGLEIGADDYISKPFHVREVLARVRSVLRRYGHAETSTQPARDDGEQPLHFNGWVVDFSKLELRSRSGEPCELTTGEFKLLEVFLNHPRRVLSRDRLMDLLRGHDWAPTDRSIDNQVARLRKKIERDPKHPTLIKTVRGMGYSFTGDVEPA